MITKNQTKNLYYLERTTDIHALAERMVRVKKSELLVFLKRKQLELFDKDNPGVFYTLDDTVKIKEGELENMNRFFRGAVVPYYIRQAYDIWTDTIPREDILRGTKEIKKMVGFMKYDYTGHITDEENSMVTFERVKDLNEFLKAIEEVCFDDNGFIYPESEHFKSLVNEKGRTSAQRQVIQELKEKHKNKHYKREI